MLTSHQPPAPTHPNLTTGNVPHGALVTMWQAGVLFSLLILWLKDAMDSSKARLIKSWKRIADELETLETRIKRELAHELTEAEAAEMRSKLVSVTAQLDKARAELQRLGGPVNQNRTEQSA